MKVLIIGLFLICPIKAYLQNSLFIAENAQFVSESNDFLALENADILNSGWLEFNNILFTGNDNTICKIENVKDFLVDGLSFQGNNRYETVGDFISSLELKENVTLHLVSGNISVTEIVGESNERTITGTPGTFLVHKSDGLTANSFGNIGFELLAADNNLGITTVYRRYTSIPVGVTETPSILRYYEILPETNENLNATANFHFTTVDLDGVDPSTLALYRQADGETTWSSEGGLLDQSSEQFWLQKEGINAFSTWAIAEANLLLPVELVFFDAEAVDNQIVFTSWETASEINNSHFEVERSLNGSDFQGIGEVAGNGTSEQHHNYSLIDEQPFNGTTYYRLKQVDFDGSYQYSTVRQVYIEQSTGIVLYPNPATERVHVIIPSSVSVDSFTMLNENGQIVAKGEHQGDQLNITISNLAAGMYVLHLTQNRKTISQIKFIKQ